MFFFLGNRKDATSYAIALDEDGKLVRNDTEITKSYHEEMTDYFLIDELESGTILMGTKFMINKMYHSKKIMGDGTFRIAPKDFLQVYILWFIVEGVCDDEDIPRAKAYPAVFICMKTKNTPEYQVAFERLERYRLVAPICSLLFS